MRQHPLRSTAQRRLAARLRKAGLLLLLLLAIPTAMARQRSAGECVEAGEFIRNAALARDVGISEADFIGRVRDDIELIQAFPPHMRWFVQNEDDAAFLLSAATDVFQKPKQAGEHRNDFLLACLRTGVGKTLSL